MNICIFLQTGKTFSFQNVATATDNESVLMFQYKAMSDGLTKVATFQKALIAGWSTHLTPDELAAAAKMIEAAKADAEKTDGEKTDG